MKKNENIYKKAVASLKKHNVIYEKPNGRKYKIFKAVYYISAVVSVLMTLAYITGQIIRLASAENSSAELISKFLPKAYLFSSCALLFIAGIIFAIKKFDLTALILTAVSASVQSIAFIPIMTGTDMKPGLHPDFWWRHFIPFFVSLVFLTVVTVIRLRANHIENRAYKNLLDSIYKENRNIADLSEKDWENFLDSYDPRIIEENRRRNKKNSDNSGIYKNQF